MSEELDQTSPIRKKINQILTSLALIAAVSAPVGYSLYTDEPTVQPVVAQAKVVGTHIAEIGQLVRLQARGNDVEWTVLPPVEDTQVFGENDQNMVVSFREVGIYTVIAAIVDEAGLSIETHEVGVGDYVIDDEEDPTVPTPPEKPTVTPVTPSLRPGIVSEVAGYAASSGLPRALAADLANNFATVAMEIEKGKVVTVTGVITRTSELNKGIDLGTHTGFMDSVQLLLTKEAEAGSLESVEDHAQVWKAIAQGLNTYDTVSKASMPATSNVAGHWVGSKPRTTTD